MNQKQTITIDISEGLYCILNFSERNVYIYYKDKNYVKQIGSIMNELVEHSQLTFIDIACFTFIIEQKPHTK